MFHQLNTIPLKPIHNTTSLVNRSIVLLKKNIFKLHTKGMYLMNNRKKMSSQESNIPGLIDILGNRNQRTFSLTPKAPPYNKRNSFILLFWVNTICKPQLSRFPENPLLPRIFRLLHTALITPNHSLKILSCPMLMSISPG